MITSNSEAPRSKQAPAPYRVRIASNLYVEFSFSGSEVQFKWTPKVPLTLNRRCLRRYQCARARFIGEVATVLGKTIAVADKISCGKWAIAAIATPPVAQAGAERVAA